MDTNAEKTPNKAIIKLEVWSLQRNPHIIITCCYTQSGKHSHTFHDHSLELKRWWLLKEWYTNTIEVLDKPLHHVEGHWVITGPIFNLTTDMSSIS